MALSGSYTLVKSEGVKEHLIADGLPEEHANKAEDHGKKVEISVSGDKVTIKRAGEPRPEQVLVLNQEVEEKFGNRTAKTKAVLNGDVLTIETKRETSTHKRVYSLSGSELTVILSSSKPGVPEAKRFYKKD